MRYVQIVGISVLVIVMAGAGLAKLFQPHMFVEQFTGFGLPAWFVYFTGSIEVVGAGLVASFNATRRRFGGAILCVTMAAAALLHAINDPMLEAAPALGLMVLAGWVALVPLRGRTNQEVNHA